MQYRIWSSSNAAPAALVRLSETVLKILMPS
jgi:hypothetical protein